MIASKLLLARFIYPPVDQVCFVHLMTETEELVQCINVMENSIELDPLMFSSKMCGLLSAEALNSYSKACSPEYTIVRSCRSCTTSGIISALILLLRCEQNNIVSVED